MLLLTKYCTMDRKQLGKGLMELVGTAVLVLTVQISVGNGNSLAPLSIGGALCIMVFVGGPISGAHLNPAVSLGILLRQKISAQEMIMYMIFQIVGGLLGALMGGFIVGTYSMIKVGTDYSLLQALFAEVLFTFLLTFVVLGVATNSNVSGNHYYGAAIGMALMVAVITIGPISGCAINPAVALGLSIASGFENFLYVFYVILVDLLGGAAAAGCFFLVAPDEYDPIATME